MGWQVVCQNDGSTFDNTYLQNESSMVSNSFLEENFFSLENLFIDSSFHSFNVKNFPFHRRNIVLNCQ